MVSRICLDHLRSRKSRREESLEIHVPDPVVTRLDLDPEAAAEQADAVTLALLVILDALNPRERMAFVLHDMFGVPFDQIGEIVGSSPAAATQLASRARRRVRETPLRPPTWPPSEGPPGVHLRRSGGRLRVAAPGARSRCHAPRRRRDARSVRFHPRCRRGGRGGEPFRRTGHEPDQVWVLVNGAVGLLGLRDGRPVSVFSPLVRDGRIVQINILTDPERLAALDLGEVL